MSGGLGKFREDIIALLRQENIPAIAAFEPEERKWLEEPTAVVSLARVTCTPGGFQNYLGTRTGADGQNEEWYGREAQLTVALDLYAPRTGGERRLPPDDGAHGGGPVEPGGRRLGSGRAGERTGGVFGKPGAVPAAGDLPLPGLAGGGGPGGRCI